MRREIATSEASARLLQEARASARLDHPSIVRVFDFGETERRDPFIVMEFLAGESLGQVLAVQARLPAVSAVPTLLPVASALVLTEASLEAHWLWRRPAICSERASRSPTRTAGGGRLGIPLGSHIRDPEGGGQASVSLALEPARGRPRRRHRRYRRRAGLVQLLVRRAPARPATSARPGQVEPWIRGSTAGVAVRF